MMQTILGIITIILLFNQNRILARGQGNMEKYNPAPGASTWLRLIRTLAFRWPLLAMIVLAIVAWVPNLLTRKSLDFGYALHGNRVLVTVNTEESGVKKPNRLMFIAKVADKTISYETDTRIIRSATFSVTSPYTQMETVMSEDFQKYLGTLPSTITMDFFVFEVKEDFPFESVKDISDAEKRGASRLGVRSMITQTFPASPVLPSSLN